jgi:FeS assembly SUF system protein
MSEESLDRAEAILGDDGPDREREAHVQALGAKVLDAIKTCYDPEIPVNIYELGLIYKVDVDDDDRVMIEMTLTSPACPVAGILPGEVQDKVRGVEGVSDCVVELVWDPPWNPSMMTEEAQLELGMFY